MASGKKCAVLVGCLYRNTQHELHGCINDVSRMKSLLLNRFGFLEGDIQVLTDDTPKTPTRTGIMSALERMIVQARPLDVLFFYFSGHGTWRHRTDSENGLQSAIVPLDAKDATALITCDDFRALVNRLPEGATLTILSDSGNSGGLIHREKEQFPDVSFESGSRIEHGINMISKSIPTNFFNSPSNIQSPLGESGADSHGGILFSACQLGQTAMEAIMPSDPAYGLFTFAVQQVLNEHDAPIRNMDLLTRAREKLRAGRFVQIPCLYCSDRNVDAIFLSQTAS